MAEHRHFVVTGGAGFIGSQLVKRLLRDGCKVTVVDDLSVGKRENVPEGVRFVKHDVCEQFPPSLCETPVDAVFHLAAQSSGENSFYEPARDARTNVVGTVQSIQYCRDHGVNRLVNMSSMSVYGEQESEIVGEDARALPCSIYGTTKFAAENIALMLGKHHGINVTNIRLFSAYGPGQDLSRLDQGIVSIYLAYLLREGRILVKGALGRFRDLIFIDDVVEALVRVERSSSTFGGTFNLGTGRKTTVAQMINLLQSAAKKTDSQVLVVDSTPGDSRGILANIENLKKAIGWSPEVSAEDGITQMVQYYDSVR